MSYQPNFQDPRVRARIKRAIGFVTGVLSPVRPHAWSTRYIDEWLGSQRNSVSKYLREQLLIVTNESYQWGEKSQCKQYILNQSGVDRLTEAIGITQITTTKQYPIVVDLVESEYQSQFESGDFVYNDQSSRLWHPLQNFRREIKQTVLEQNGYQHHYDIECCAMTLIHQHSQRIPEVIQDSKWQSGPMDLYLFALRDYLRDRKTIRQQIALEADIDTDTVKRIVNALLAGAKLSANPDTEIYQMLDGDIARIRFLQQHKYLTDLRADIKTCWDYIKITIPPRMITTTTGRIRRLPLSSRQKWMLYFDLERQVLNEIREFLRDNNIRHFLEHDGWSCESEIDLDCLSQRVFEKTGFRVEFEKK
jgi:hypothetical protein